MNNFEDFMAAPEEVIDREFIKVKDFIKDDMLNLCVFMGNSGCGKSTLEKKLVEMYPDIFFKLPQVTTREKRPTEDGTEYYFVNDVVYDIMHKKLIGRITGNTFNDAHYGTIPVFRDKMINTIILSADGLEDLIFNSPKKLFKHLNIAVVEMSIEPTNVTVTGKREGRDQVFLEAERTNIKIRLQEIEKSGLVKKDRFKHIQYEYEDFNRFPIPTDIFDFS